MRNRLGIASVVAVLTALTYFIFPGHTYLQQDTQIYLPMLDKLMDPSLYTRELLTSHPHMAWTLYDEVTVALRRMTGLGFEQVLTLQQLLFRALGIWGVFLIGTSLGFTRRLSLFVAALFSLGATIAGPSVLTFEYEPVPRGFAVPLVILAVGLLLTGRPLRASIAGAAAMLYHLPTTAPLWIVLAIVIWRSRNWKILIPPAAAMGVVVLFSRLQPGMTEPQPLFSLITPALRELQKMRAAYNWVTLWTWPVLTHYVVMFAIALLAILRLGNRITGLHRIVFGGLLGIGVASIPFSFVALELMHWSAIPQFQPARAVLFITFLAVILSGYAAMQAAYRGRYQETFAWLLAPFIIPVHPVVLPPYTLPHALLVIALAGASTAALAVHVLSPRRAAAALAMAALSAFFAIPMLGGVRNYPALWTSEIRDLARWAAANTDRDAVFHFAGAGKDLSPGLFRVEAKRSVYVEWKTGGQVNYFEDLALEWWERWRNTMLRAAPESELAARGVDYLVTKLPDTRQGQHLYSNAKYVVYRLR